jgi:glycosyltransferase involved in cell wall biosynthesis
MIVYFAWFVFAFTAIQFTVTIANLVFSTKLKKSGSVEKPLVSVLIPARDEEKNIGNILSDLVCQDYTNIEVLVFDDLSSDNTPEIVQEFAVDDDRVRLIGSGHLPSGWFGKNWGCHSLALAASGKYFLFLDADVRAGNGLISNALSYAEHYNLSLISVFPEQIIVTRGEMMTVPVMNYILLSLLPLVLVRKSGMASLSAANGQFMFFDSDTYKSLLPHEKMKNNMVEDIAIAHYFKANGFKIACLTGDNSIQCRMYSGFSEAVNGFSKNVAAFFGNSLLLAFFFWIVTSVGFIFVLIALPAVVSVVYFSGYLLTRIIISRISGQRITGSLLYLIPQQVSLGLFIWKSFIKKTLKSHRWKDRELT